MKIMVAVKRFRGPSRFYSSGPNYMYYVALPLEDVPKGMDEDFKERPANVMNPEKTFICSEEGLPTGVVATAHSVPSGASCADSTWEWRLAWLEKTKKGLMFSPLDLLHLRGLAHNAYDDLGKLLEQM